MLKSARFKMYTAAVLRIVLYERLAWSFTLTEQHSLLFESVVNKLPRKIFGPKGEEGTKGCWKLRNVKLHNLYFSANRAVSDG
jgi:hypothetical protein